MTNPTAARPNPNHEVTFRQAAVPDPGVLVASLVTTDLVAFLRTPWFQSLYQSSDKGDHWMALTSVNSATDIVAFVVWDAKKAFLAAPAGLQAVVELFYVEGSVRHSAVLSTPERKLSLKAVSIGAVRDYLQKTAIGAHFGPSNAARLTLERLEMVEDQGRTLLKVWGEMRLRKAAFKDHDPGSFEREAMIFALEDKGGELEVEAFCLNVLAQKVFSRVVRGIDHLGSGPDRKSPRAAGVTGESTAPGPIVHLSSELISRGVDIAMPIDGKPNAILRINQGRNISATQAVEHVPPIEAWPEAAEVHHEKYPTDLEDDRLKVIKQPSHRRIIALWNAGELSAKEIAAMVGQLQKVTIWNIVSSVRKQHPDLVRPATKGASAKAN